MEPKPPGWARELAKVLGSRGGKAWVRKHTAEERQARAAMGGKASAKAKNGRRKRKKKEAERKSGVD